MARIGTLIIGIALLMAPAPARAQGDVPDLRGDWVMTTPSTDDAAPTVTTEWQIYAHDRDTGQFFGRVGEQGAEDAIMTGEIKGDAITMTVDIQTEEDAWDRLVGTIQGEITPVISGEIMMHRLIQPVGITNESTGWFEMRRADDGAEAPVASPTVVATPLAAEGEPAADAEDLRGRWTWDAISADGEVFPTHEFIVTVHDPETDVVAGDLFDDESRLVTMMAGRIDDEELKTRMTFMGAKGGWSDFSGTRVPGEERRYAGTYEVQNTGETGTFEAAFAGPIVETEPDAGAGSSATDTDETPAATTAVCDDTRLTAAAAALAGATPYTAMTSLQVYDGNADELSYRVLVEEHVADPVTWDRTTNVRGDAGWSILESRRLGDEVWMRLDGGEWSVEAPEAGVLGTPWALDILGEQLMPGGQAADPVAIWNQVGEQCIVSQLFRAEDGGKGRGRVSRLTFVGDDVLPRTVEWEAVRPPTGRIKGKATRPGEIESILITLASGAVAPIEAPSAAE